MFVGNLKSSDGFGIVSILKFIVPIGIILVIFKFTMSYIKPHFKKSVSDEMNTCFVESDTEVSCNLELTA